MDLRKLIPREMTASVAAHLAVLALAVLFSDVHPFGAVIAEPIAVDIVGPEEIAEGKLDPSPTPTSAPDLSALEKPATASEPVSAPTDPAPSSPTRPQKQAALATPRPERQQTPVQPQPEQQRPPQSTSPVPVYAPPEPDISIKYHVLLGLPPNLPPAPPQSADKAGDNFDAPATKAADVASSLVEDFRRHLKTCSKLPPSLTRSDDVKVRLRLFMSPEGRLAADPVLIEASASAKGPMLMQGAISALEACQPYAMLPADRYGEWKVLDLSFTPQDF